MHLTCYPKCKVKEKLKNYVQGVHVLCYILLTKREKKKRTKSKN